MNERANNLLGYLDLVEEFLSRDLPTTDLGLGIMHKDLADAMARLEANFQDYGKAVAGKLQEIRVAQLESRRLASEKKDQARTVATPATSLAAAIAEIEDIVKAPVSGTIPEMAVTSCKLSAVVKAAKAAGVGDDHPAIVKATDYAFRLRDAAIKSIV